jgi:nucleoside phosphorylase
VLKGKQDLTSATRANGSSDVAIAWRETLRSLLTQFEAAAARSLGLHHLFVELGTGERHKASGPIWFTPFNGNIRFVDGKPQYEQWDCCASRGLPTIHPSFRAPRPQEEFAEGDSTVVRDRSGVVRAVAVPMKTRQGYYCGQGSEGIAKFESLANAAAVALADSGDLQTHAFASDLTDIFRKPRGGVRFAFGDVFGAPNRFMSHGWNAGVLVSEHGVLIDVPISESSPDASNWLLLLHRLGWRRVEGSGLRAERFAWDGNVEVDLESLLQDPSQIPDQFRKAFGNVSKESFYSVIGTKEAALDINLASAFAIQILLADLAPTFPVKKQQDQKTDYSRETWHALRIPALETVNRDEATRFSQPRVGILVATEIERQAVLKKMRPPGDKECVLQVFLGNNTCFLGRLGLTDVVLCMTSTGSVGRDASTIVTVEMIQSWQLSAIIMAGIAFGKDATKQQIGHVLVADRIISYDSQRIGKASNENRGAEPMASPVLLNRFRNVLDWKFTAPNGEACGFQVGPVLSGEKLVDNSNFKQELFDRYPAAIGGEMEGSGIAAAAERNRCEWIVVKAICDWGDGTKTSEHQEFAAASSVDLVEHVLNQPGALDALVQRST